MCDVIKQRMYYRESFVSEWLVLGDKTIKKLAELAKEEGVVLDYYIGPEIRRNYACRKCKYVFETVEQIIKTDKED